jgi:hypothetical protein
MDVVRRAYELWQQAGEPSGKDDEFYHRAKKELQEALDKENAPRREGRVCTAPSIGISGRNLGRRMIELVDLVLKFGCEVTQVLVRNAVRELTRQPVALGELISKFLLFPVHFH